MRCAGETWGSGKEKNGDRMKAPKRNVVQAEEVFQQCFDLQEVIPYANLVYFQAIFALIRIQAGDQSVLSLLDINETKLKNQPDGYGLFLCAKSQALLAANQIQSAKKAHQKAVNVGQSLSLPAESVFHKRIQLLNKILG